MLLHSRTTPSIREQEAILLVASTVDYSTETNRKTESIQLGKVPVLASTSERRDSESRIMRCASFQAAFAFLYSSSSSFFFTSRQPIGPIFSILHVRLRDNHDTVKLLSRCLYYHLMWCDKPKTKANFYFILATIKEQTNFYFYFCGNQRANQH